MGKLSNDDLCFELKSFLILVKLSFYTSIVSPFVCCLMCKIWPTSHISMTLDLNLFSKWNHIYFFLASLCLYLCFFGHWCVSFIRVLLIHCVLYILVTCVIIMILQHISLSKNKTKHNYLYKWNMTVQIEYAFLNY